MLFRSDLYRRRFPVSDETFPRFGDSAWRWTKLPLLNVLYCSCAVISKYDIGGTTATVNLTIYNTKGCNPGVVSTVLLELKL